MYIHGINVCKTTHEKITAEYYGDLSYKQDFSLIIFS